MIPEKNKGGVRTVKTKFTKPDSYRLSCFVCYGPHEGATIGTYTAQQRRADGREIFIRYDICSTCINEIKKEGRPDLLLDFRELRLRLQLEPLAARLAEHEQSRKTKPRGC